MATTAQRLGRYLAPAFVVSAAHYLRSRALVSLAARVQWGPGISFGPGTVIKPFAIVQHGSGVVRFGRDCAISSFCHVSTGSGDIIAGDYVRLAANCTLAGGTREIQSREVLLMEQPEQEKKGIRIGDDVLVGAGSVILPGARIGRGAVIGAGSVVSGEVPEYAIVAGAPARVIGERS